MLVEKLFSTEIAKHIDLASFMIFHDKKYLGKSGHEHQIDVSAELNIGGVRILILVECKRYANKVGIDDVMEFATRLEDIGAHKGIVCTTEGFQRGAIKIAKSKGITLVRACDIGWSVCTESPVEEIKRHKEFCNSAKIFLSWYLGPDIEEETLENAVERISRFDVVSPLGGIPQQFGSLGKDDEWRVLFANIFTPTHAFTIAGDGSEIILDTRGLFALLSLELELELLSKVPKVGTVKKD